MKATVIFTSASHSINVQKMFKVRKGRSREEEEGGGGGRQRDRARVFNFPNDIILTSFSSSPSSSSFPLLLSGDSLQGV